MKNKSKNSWDTMFTGANGRISSKRVLGCFILLVLLVVLVICVLKESQFVWLGEAIITMMIGAFALLGIGVFEKRFKTPLPDETPTSEEVPEEEPGNEAEQCS